MAAHGAGVEPARRLRIAVIDSGVNPAHPHVGEIAGGVTITAHSEEPGFLDQLGHGTAVMAAIQEKAPDADYFAVRIFEARLQTNIGVVIRAVEWCVRHEMDIVNLSLGTTNAAHASRFAPCTNSLIVVSARFAGSKPAYPGSLNSVIGVEADASLSRDRYSIRADEGQVTFLASPYPRPIPGVPKERNLNGVSFAVANMCGFVARECMTSGKLSCDQVVTQLISGAR